MVVGHHQGRKVKDEEVGGYTAYMEKRCLKVLHDLKRRD
jgi:hypothetical protein